MIDKIYNKQLELLLKVLPEVAKESDFALHGGTAINLFVRNMPRLSVDIDLTYIPIEKRDISITKINLALTSIKKRLEKVIPEVRIRHKEEVGKLIISLYGIDVKLEVNLVSRGLLDKANELSSCKKITNDYGAFIEIQVVSFGQLYGSKICAALDRQHPRDLFDIKFLLENEGLSNEVMRGFLLSLISNDRTMYELLKPNLLDQRLAMTNQFTGMSAETFTYNDFETTRHKLIKMINQTLTMEDKKFLLSVKSLNPSWEIYNFANFPAIRWKLQNLGRLQKDNPKKYHYQFNLLQEHLFAELD